MSKACLAEARTTSLDLVYALLGSKHPAALRQLRDYTELHTALSLPIALFVDSMKGEGIVSLSASKDETNTKQH